MRIFGNVSLNTNASLFKRFLSFFIDTILISVIKVFTIQYLFFTRSKAIFLEFFESFNNLFPDLKASDFTGTQIRYITSSTAYREMFIILLSLISVTIIYKLIFYILFRKTIGQKITGLTVVNNDENDSLKKQNLLQAISRGLLETIPSNILFLMIFLIPFNVLNFYKYTIHNNDFVINFFTNLIRISNVNFLFISVFVYILFWFNIFFFSNKFFLHDIITHTRVVDNSYVDKELIENKILKKVDNFTDFLKKVNNYYFNKIKKVFSKCKKS